MNQLALPLDSNTPPGAPSGRYVARSPGRKAEPARARRDDPDTSKAAAKRAEEFAGEHRRKILAALMRAPGTYKEIAERCGLERHAVARRLPEMFDLGVCKSDERRDGCSVWKVA